jgi:hypothetical protein
MIKSGDLPLSVLQGRAEHLLQQQDPVRVALNAWLASGQAPLFSLGRMKHTLRPAAAAPQGPPTLQELRECALTAGALAARGVTLAQLVGPGRAVPVADKAGLAALVASLKLTLDEVLSNTTTTERPFGCAPLAEAFGVRDVALLLQELLAARGMKREELLRAPWLVRLRPSDWQVLDRPPADKLAAMDRDDVCTMLRAAPPDAWARVAGLRATDLTSVWALGTTLDAVAKRLGWDAAATRRAFAAVAAGASGKK